MRSTILVAGLALFAAGCGKKEPVPAEAVPATPAAAEASAESPAAAGAAPVEPAVGSVQSLQVLATDNPNPVVRNNAKAALEAWNRKDYASAVVFLKTVISLPEGRLQANEVVGVMAAMQAELQRAAQGGNQAAKAALQDLLPPPQ